MLSTTDLNNTFSIKMHKDQTFLFLLVSFQRLFCWYHSKGITDVFRLCKFIANFPQTCGTCEGSNFASLLLFLTRAPRNKSTPVVVTRLTDFRFIYILYIELCWYRLIGCWLCQGVFLMQWWCLHLPLRHSSECLYWGIGCQLCRDVCVRTRWSWDWRWCMIASVHL